MTARRNLLTLAIALTMGGMAHAADLASDSVIKAPVLEEDYSSGWYVRGDVFGVMYGTPIMGYTPNAGAFNQFGNASIDRSFGGGIGGGLRYKWFRTDITFDYRAPSQWQGTTPTTTESGQFSAFSGLWNVYTDLGTWGGLTPYIGAGIGASQIKTWGYASTPGGLNAARAGTSWHFSYAGMAGVSANVTPQMSVDLGYRYLNLGSVGYSDGAGVLIQRDLQAHEVRLGVRYQLH